MFGVAKERERKGPASLRLHRCCCLLLLAAGCCPCCRLLLLSLCTLLSI